MTTSMFLTSCGSSLSVTKRQHNKGYFVSSSKNYSTSPEKVKVTHKKESIANQAVEEVAELKKPTKANQSQDDFATVSTTYNENKVSKNNLKEADILDITETSSSVHDKTERTDSNQPRTIKAAKNKIKSTVSSSEKSEKSERSEGRSLLWIIIVVLIILWALGLIGGLSSSGLIHLLLVIALILLILWLLKVI